MLEYKLKYIKDGLYYYEFWMDGDKDAIWELVYNPEKLVVNKMPEDNRGRRYAYELMTHVKRENEKYSEEGYIAFY